MALPGAAVLTMIGGDIFGPVNAVLYVVIGATIGATLAFGAARGLIRDWVEARYPRAVTWLQTAVGNDPVGTMLALRFIPAFPFFAVNLVAGLTRIRPLTYILTTLFGIIPGTFLYAYAGRQLGEVRSVNELARPSVLAAMFVVGFSVLVPGWLASRWRGSNRNKRTGGGDAIRGPEPRERSSPPPSPSSIPPASGP
jgi:uncharacterized membrane protein YdjX (TVP38/TMEM64 family)